MRKASLTVMLLILLSKFFGFFREIVIAYNFGAEEVVDAYNVAITIPRTLARFFSAALGAALIPIYFDIKNKMSSEDADRFINKLLSLFLVIVTVVIVIVIVFTRQTIFVLASGFEGTSLNTAIAFTRITVFSMYFVILTSVLAQYLRAKSVYWVTAVLGIPMNILIIVFTVLSAQVHVMLLAIGYLIAIGSQAFLITIVSKINKFHYKFDISLNDKYIKTFMLVIVPVLISVSMRDIKEIISQNIASRIDVGAVSIFNYSKRLNHFIQGIVVIGLTTVMFPMISKLASNKSFGELTKIVSDSIVLAGLFIIPAVFGIIFFPAEIVTLVFGRGAFDRGNISDTANALLLFSFGMFPMSVVQILKRVFFSMKNTRIPLYSAILSLLVYSPAVLLFYNFTDLGVGGLALASTISSISTCGFLLLSLKIKIIEIQFSSIVVPLTKIILASLIMGIIGLYFYRIITVWLSTNLNLLFMITIGVSGILYFSLLLLFRVDEIIEFKEIAVAKFLNRETKGHMDNSIENDTNDWD